MSIKELMAAAIHVSWSNWMSHLFKQGTFNEDGTWTMPKEKVERWQRQILTEYNELTESEKQSDRDQVDLMLNYEE